MSLKKNQTSLNALRLATTRFHLWILFNPLFLSSLYIFCILILYNFILCPSSTYCVETDPSFNPENSPPPLEVWVTTRVTPENTISVTYYTDSHMAEENLFR